MKNTNKLSIIKFEDANVLLLKIEFEKLELTHADLISEKSDIEIQIGEFHYRHSIELGDVILKILYLKKLSYNSNSMESNQAEADYNSYFTKYEEDRLTVIYQLTEIEKQNLRYKYRKALHLCHPDKIDKKYEKIASNMFNELKKAYLMNNLNRVDEILCELETDNPFSNSLPEYSEIAEIKHNINKLKNEISRLKLEIEQMKYSDIYRTISAIENWDVYFNNTKRFLEQELQNLHKQ